MGDTGDTASCWKGAWGSPNVGIKTALCISSKQLLGSAGHPEESFGFVRAVPRLSLGQLPARQPLVLFSLSHGHSSQQAWSPVASTSVCPTLHTLFRPRYRQEQPEPGAGPGGYL